MNSQPIEKLAPSTGSLEVHSIFYTIQGEGPFCGVPAIFIRLAGCNLQCPGCDTDYTSTRERLRVGAIMDRVETLCEDEYPDAPRPLIVLTGGEPFRQDVAELCNVLSGEGYVVQIETNGTLPVSKGLSPAVHIVCSPKTGKIHESVSSRASALKYVVKAGAVMRDGLPTRALDHTCSPCVYKPEADFKGTVYVQPMDEGFALGNRRNLQTAMVSCMKNGYTLQVQMHKVIGVA
jgi:7-carboxy-7-deazaguanine synthase